MGRFVKNQQVGVGSTAIQIPVGDATERPSEAVFGQIRFNTTVAKVEYFDGTNWTVVAKHGDAIVVVDSFTGNGSTTVYVLSEEVVNADADQILVFAGNIYQIPTTNYTVSTVGGVSSITFTSAPPNTTSINVIHNLASTP
jgi:hypothetical protein